MAGKGKGGRGKSEGKTQSRSSRAGITFPVGRIARYMRDMRVADRIGGSRLGTGVSDQSTIDGLGDLLHAHRNHGVSNSFTITLRPVSTDLIEIIGHMQGTAYVVFPHAGGQHHGDGQGHVPESDAVIHCR